MLFDRRTGVKNDGRMDGDETNGITNRGE